MQFLRRLRNASTAAPAMEDGPQPSAAAEDGDGNNITTTSLPVVNTVDNKDPSTDDTSGQDQGTRTTPSSFGGQPPPPSIHANATSSEPDPVAASDVAGDADVGGAQTLSVESQGPSSTTVPPAPARSSSAITAASTPVLAPRTQQTTSYLQDPQNPNQPSVVKPSVVVKSMTVTNEPNRTDPRAQQASGDLGHGDRSEPRITTAATVSNQNTPSPPLSTIADATDPSVASGGNRQTAAVAKPVAKSTAAVAADAVEPVAALVASSPRFLHRQLKEERLQALAEAHKEKLRRLAAERHQIAQQQSLYGASGPMTAAAVAAAAGHGPPPLWRPASDEDGREVRASARQQMIEQLQTEQVAALAALKALKKGKTLDEARRIGNMQYEKQYQQQQQQRDQANVAKKASWRRDATKSHQLTAAAKPAIAAAATAATAAAAAAVPPALLTGAGLPRSSSVLLRLREREREEEEAANAGERRDPSRRVPAGHGGGGGGGGGGGSNTDLGPPTPTRGSSPTIQGRGLVDRRRAESLDRGVRLGGIGGSTGWPNTSPSLTSALSYSSMSSSPSGLRSNALRLARREEDDLESGRGELQTARGTGAAGGPEAQVCEPPTTARPLQPANDQQIQRPPTVDQLPPSYIEELKEQVKALQVVVEQHITTQQQRQHQPQQLAQDQQNQQSQQQLHDQDQAYRQLQQQQLLPGYAVAGQMPPPFWPMPMYAMPPPPPPQQQQPAPPPPPPPPPPPKPVDPILAGLPPEVAADPDLRAAHNRHTRDMALLRMEIDRARTAAELEQIRAVLQQIRGTSESTPSQKHQQDPQQQQEQQQQDELKQQQAAEAAAAAAAAAASAGFGAPPPFPPPEEAWPEQPWARAGGGEREGMQLVPGGEVALDREEGNSTLGEGLPYTNQEDLSEVMIRNSPPPPMSRLGFMPESHVLEVRLFMAGPFHKRGTYRVRAVLYDGFQPMEAAPGVMVGASSLHYEPTSEDDMGGGG
ncbi:hypothetical protein VaNZ11_005887, partial [Volvox africanus]